jgi:nucleoside-diphosphate-sugar epimerase
MGRNPNKAEQGNMRGLWQRYRSEWQKEFREFPLRGAALRMLADFLAVNVSLLGAFVIWFFVYVTFLGAKGPELAVVFRNFVKAYWVFWGVLAVLVFHLNGFYTRTRSYHSRYKMAVVARAVTLFMVLLVFTDYLLLRSELIPRGVAVIGWFLTLLTVGGMRFTKDYILAQYSIQPKAAPKRIERVLVVGGAGYLGSSLVLQLLAKRYKVRVMDSLLFGDESLAAARANPDFEMVRGDVRDIQAVVEAMKDCQGVIHLAAIVGDPACEESPELAIEINKVATKMLIEIAKGYGVSRFVFASTCSVYGASDFLVDEYTRPGPISTYARTKVDSEQLLIEAQSETFIPVVLRLGTLFGLSARPRFDLVVNLLTAKAATSGEITIYNGEQWRPFVHVSDAARAFLACLEASPATVSGEIFNVGDSRLNARLSEVSEKIGQIIPAVKVEHIDNADRRNYRASFDKIRTRLGFECRVMLEDGIREIYEAIAKAEIPDFRDRVFNNQAITREFAQRPESERSSIQVLLSLAQKEGPLQ